MSNTATRTRATPLLPPRVVIADDHRMVREAIRKAVEDDGIRVIAEASDGEEAVRMAVGLQPDLILMDISMPLIDGVEATKRIHRMAPEVVVMVLSMHSDSETIERAIKAGASGYMVKDIRLEEIVDGIRACVRNDSYLSPELARRILHEAENLEEENEEVDTGVAITQREEEILNLVCEGLSTQEIADQLMITPKTVKNHLASIYTKLESRDRTQAVIKAVKMGIIKLD